MRLLRAGCLAALWLAAGCNTDGLSPLGVERGESEDDGLSGDAGARRSVNGCEPHVVQASTAIPDMLIVLDRSASMAPDGNTQRTDRWAGSVDAVTEVTLAFDDRIHFGLMTFPGPQASGGGRGDNGRNVCATGSSQVDIAGDTGPEVARALEATSPGGYTPTAATLREALAVIGDVGLADQTVVPPKYVLLVTDGDPNCASGPGGPVSNDPVARMQTIDAITALANAGVQTFVVGYQTGSSEFASTLDDMAAAGATGEREHRSVESGRDLTDTFEDIAGRALSCSYKLAAPVDDASFVLVKVAQQARDYRNTDDGWTLGPDMQTVTLTGAACDAVRDGSAFSVQVVCEPQFVH